MAAGWIEEWKSVHEPATRGTVIDGAPAPAAAPFANDYFTCLLCNLKEYPEHMRPIQMHDYCVSAVLKPALRFFGERHAYVERPRTLEDARELISDLLEQFPALLPPDGSVN